MTIRFRRRNDGFSLLEILVVIAVLGILAAIAIPQLNLHRFKGFMATVRTDAKNVHTAVVSWAIDNPGASFPEISEFTGPGILPNYGVASISKGVKVSISNTGDVTATHEGLLGSFKIYFQGANREDTLSPPY